MGKEERAGREGGKVEGKKRMGEKELGEVGRGRAKGRTRRQGE